MGSTKIIRHRTKSGNTISENIRESPVSSTNRKILRRVVPHRRGSSTRRSVIIITVHHIPRTRNGLGKSNCGIRVGKTLVNNLTFADDMHLINKNCKFLKERFESIRAIAEQAGLIVNMSEKQNEFSGTKLQIQKYLSQTQRSRMV